MCGIKATLVCVLTLTALTVSLASTSNDFARACTGSHSSYPFCDTSLSTADRVKDLISRLQLSEKLQQMDNTAPGVERIGLPSYQWWSESLHGVNSNCDPVTKRCPTSFPNGISMAAAFNTKLLAQMANAISDEARALRSANVTNFLGATYGLDVWAPNLNIARDPRWGRGQETPGEDVYLTGLYGAIYARGVEGTNSASKYLKLVSTMKHFDAYSLENWGGVDRHHFDANVTQQDLQQTYYAGFRTAVQEGSIHGVMCSYNAVNGVPSCANAFLKDELRGKWGFDGYVTSDCGAIADIYINHKYVKTGPEAAAVAIKAGTDLDCGGVYGSFGEAAVTSGLLSEDDVDAALTHLFTLRMRLGMFDPLDNQPYSKIPIDVVESNEHLLLAEELATEAITLLKNDPVNGKTVLPLDGSKPIKIALIGPNSNATDQLCSNYHGSLGHVVSIQEALNDISSATVSFNYGCDVLCADDSGFAAAVSAARDADVAVLVMGINQNVESEGHDRTSTSLPGKQDQLVSEVLAVQPNTVVVLVNGGQVSIENVKANAPAILEAYYPGQLGGAAVANVLFGKYSPSGRLPYTMYPSDYVNQISMFDMNMRGNPGRTYRFYQGDVLYPFGYGLSYTEFTFDLTLDSKTDDVITDPSQTMNAHVTVKNTGAVDSDVSVLVFVTMPENAGKDCPLSQLVGFAKLTDVKAGEIQSATVPFTPADARCYDTSGNPTVPAGDYQAFVLGLDGSRASTVKFNVSV